MTALLSCRDLVVEYATADGPLRAVDRVSLDIEHGQTLALVGESGCGKSTLARAIMGLTRVTSGSIKLEGRELVGLSAREFKPHRPSIQMVFQNPYGSLNPRLSVGRIVEEPMLIQKIGTSETRRKRVLDLLDRVGLASAAATQYPHQFSGGQRQRVAIARALALNPKLIVCDEPVSALDVSVQAQVLNLLVELQKDLGISYLFISHDLAVVRHIAHATAVMYLGRMAARSTSREFWKRPAHPYVQALKEATPSMEAIRAGISGHPILEGEIPSALNPPPGCRFSPRCRYGIDICRRTDPPLRQLNDRSWVACHRVTVAADGTVEPPEPLTVQG